jgi:hypothetical protein
MSSSQAALLDFSVLDIGMDDALSIASSDDATSVVEAAVVAGCAGQHVEIEVMGRDVVPGSVQRV